jgi:hypothetical protein
MLPLLFGLAVLFKENYLSTKPRLEEFFVDDLKKSIVYLFYFLNFKAPYEFKISITDVELLGMVCLEQHKDTVWVASSLSGNKIVIYHALSMDFLGSFIASDTRISAIKSVGTNVWTCAGSEIRLWDCQVTLKFLLNVLCLFSY